MPLDSVKASLPLRPRARDDFRLVEGPDDKRSKRSSDRTPIGLAVRLSYGTVDEFADHFAVNISRGGLFILTRDPKPVGTAISFELRLQTGEVALRGTGVVRWVQAESATASPPAAPGMGVQFTELDDASRALVERIVALKDTRGIAPGVVAPAPIAPRPKTTPSPTRAPTPTIPVPRAATPSPAGPTLTPKPTLTPSRTPALTPAPRPGAVLADLSAPHRVEQLSAGGPRIDVGLPATPQPIKRRTRTIIGIDLGTTNSCAAVVKDGKPYVIPSREGHNTVPSVVALNSRLRIVVGHLAKAQLLTNPKATVYGAKRLVGRPFESDVVQDIRAKFAYEIVPDADGLAAVRLGPETLSLEQVSALVLREVKEVAQNHLGEEVNRAVITVPAYYNERQRAAVRNAGGLAGLHVERILNEPTAAALAYAFGRHLNQRVLVYDLGGGTFDASVLELNDNVYEVVSTGGDTFLGGVDFDNRVVERLLEAWREKTGAPFEGDRVALSRLVDAAERAKCALSARTDFTVQLPFLALRDGQPVSLDASVTRAEVVAMVEPLVDRTIEVCREVLAAKGLQPKDIDEVLLVGGQSRMPLVHQKVAAFFGKQPSRSVHPDEAVAVGAALLAHSLGSAEGVVLIDVLPMSLGIGLPGGRVKSILERNTALPARKQYGLATTRDGQTEFELVVLQGESTIAAECEYLGTLKLAGLPPGPRGLVKIAVTFELGAECLLTVTAREMNSGKQVQAVMSTKEGPAAARRRLEEGGGADGATAKTSSFPTPGLAARGGISGFLRRLFGRSDEAR
jgi:molecular chaperone DnaK